MKIQLFLVLALFQWLMLTVECQIEDEYKLPPPYFQSPAFLQYFANQDRKIYNAMKGYEEELEERVDLVEKYLVDYESSTVAGTIHLDSEEERDKLVVHHPILAFRMLSRFAKEFDALDRHISGGAEEALSEVISEAKHAYGFLPNEYDVDEAEDAILGMQFMYDVPAAQIANGQIPGGETIIPPVNLTAEQCYSIAKNAKTSRYYTLALDWLDEIKRRMKNGPPKEGEEEDNNYYDGITEESVDTEILRVIKEHNEMYEQKFEYEQGSFYSELLGSGSVGGPRPSTMRNDMLARYSDKSHLNYPENLYARNIALCNGKHIRPPKEESTLKCWLDRGSTNPYWTIHPLKIELLNESPQIIQFTYVIPDPWISELKNLSYAYVRNIGPVIEAIVSSGGTSWHSDHEFPKVPLSRKIELATGLNVRGPRCSAKLQVGAYALYGSAIVHTDHAKDKYPEVEKGLHGVFTFLIYLNDVETGGSTAFPKLGFSVKPEKGSAIFFHTKEKVNGTADVDVSHGACPLIYGEKWIATKSISAIENMFFP